MEKQKPMLTPYYEALGVTQAQYEVMQRFQGAYWKAFVKPGFRALKDNFESRFDSDEIKLRDHCILHHTMLGSTPPEDNTPYVFDIGGKYEAWIPELEQLGR